MRKYPFKFLNSYSKEDKAIFFGREEEINSLYRMVFQTNLLLVYGASGTGKTSLIRCGLANRFEAYQWQDLYIRRGDDINKNLLKIVQEKIPATISATTEENEKGWFKNLMEANVATTKQSNSTALSENKSPIVEALNDLYQASFTPIYLIFDQFEELYTLGKKEEQEKLLRTIHKLVHLPLPLKIIIVMREEYLAKLYELEEIVPQLRNKKLRLAQMDRLKVEEVILKATRDNKNSNIHLEKGKEEKIATAIVEKIREDDINIQLPYLQVFMDHLYEQTSGEKLNRSVEVTLNLQLVEAQKKIGDVLAKFLERQSQQIYNKLKKSFKDLPSDVVWRILSPFATIGGTKVPIKDKDYSGILKSLKLSASQDLKKLIPTALVELENSRILRYRKDSKTYEVTHDSLAKLIAEKRSEDEKSFLKAKRMLTEGYTTYLDTKTFLSKEQLNFIKPFASELSQEINAEQQKFVSRSKNKKQQRLRFSIALVSSVMMIMSILTFWALTQTTKARSSQKATLTALTKANKLVDALYFYNNRFALVFKKSQYYFIDKNGVKIEEFKEWDNAEHFDWRGFAKVKKRTREKIDLFLLDTLGTTYKVEFRNEIDSPDFTAWDLSGKNLTNFPQAFFKQKQLKVLLFDNNLFEDLPTQIGHLDSLVYLNLDNNKIKKLPATIGQLSNLISLDLSYNLLTTLPKNIEALKRLKYLDLNANLLITLPPEIGTLTNLATLDLRNNQLEELPALLGQLNNLSFLDVGANKLERLPMEIGALSNLAYLNLSLNQLTELPEEIGQLTALTSLDLRFNQLKQLPSGFKQLNRLTSLDLGANKLEQFPSEILHLSNLSSLNLSKNNLSELPLEIEQLKKLIRLDLRGNPISLSQQEHLQKLLPKCKILFPNPLEFFVFDEDSKLPLEGATVVNSCTGETLTTDVEGKIIVDMELNDCCDFKASYDGYKYNTNKAHTKNVQLGDLVRLEILLERRVIENPATCLWIDTQKGEPANSNIDGIVYKNGKIIVNKRAVYTPGISPSDDFLPTPFHFDFNKIFLREDDLPELEKLLAVLKLNPDLILEIGSHTDSRGSYRYNNNLSQRRSESIIRWLRKKGINSERLVAKGYGENEILNNCSNNVPCSEEEHQYNRRTEFKVIGCISCDYLNQTISTQSDNVTLNPMKTYILFKNNKDYNQDLSDLSFYTLFANKPQEAIAAAKEALQLNPSARSNLALGYLLNNQWIESEKIYLKWRGKYFPGKNQLWDDIFLNDIKALEREDIHHVGFAKAKELFNKQ